MLITEHKQQEGDGEEEYWAGGVSKGERGQMVGRPGEREWNVNQMNSILKTHTETDSLVSQLRHVRVRKKTACNGHRSSCSYDKHFTN